MRDVSLFTIVASLVGGSACSACLLVCLRLNVPPQVSVSEELSESGSESEEAIKPGSGGEGRRGAAESRGLGMWRIGGTGGLRKLGGVERKYPGIRRVKGSLRGGGEGVRGGGGVITWSTSEMAAAPIRLRC